MRAMYRDRNPLVKESLVVTGSVWLFQRHLAGSRDRTDEGKGHLSKTSEEDADSFCIH